VIAGHHGGLADYYRNPDNQQLQGAPLSERLAKDVRDWLPYAPAELLDLRPAQSLAVPLAEDDSLFQLSFLVRMLSRLWSMPISWLLRAFSTLKNTGGAKQARA
jgi:hypothetical protein